jgi:uncharacterized protein (DUF4213/DUF364 family)
MSLLEALLSEIQEGAVLDVSVGLHWTAVCVDVAGEVRCGLASTLRSPHVHGGPPHIPQAGELTELDGRTVAEFARERERPALASVGVAALNALLPKPTEADLVEINAEDVLAERGRGGNVAIVGNFPFVPRLREVVGQLWVIEQDPGPGEWPPEAAGDLLPNSDVIAITGMALINHTLEELLSLCPAEARVMVLGPSAPLSAHLYSYGVDIISGSLVADIESVTKAVRQGANFRQVHRAGVRLVTMTASSQEKR